MEIFSPRLCTLPPCLLTNGCYVFKSAGSAARWARLLERLASPDLSGSVFRAVCQSRFDGFITTSRGMIEGARRQVYVAPLNLERLSLCDAPFIGCNLNILSNHPVRCVSLQLMVVYCKRKRVYYPSSYLLLAYSRLPFGSVHCVRFAHRMYIDKRLYDGSATHKTRTNYFHRRFRLFLGKWTKWEGIRVLFRKLSSDLFGESFRVVAQ